jgi:hypothetical protein
MDPKFRIALFGGTHLSTNKAQNQGSSGLSLTGPNPFNPPKQDTSMSTPNDDDDSMVDSCF